jgi:hypothetical protein
MVLYCCIHVHRILLPTGVFLRLLFIKKGSWPLLDIGDWPVFVGERRLNPGEIHFLAKKTAFWAKKNL